MLLVAEALIDVIVALLLLAAEPEVVAASEAVARRFAMQLAAVGPLQHETKSGPPTEAQEEQNLGVHATLPC